MNRGDAMNAFLDGVVATADWLNPVAAAPSAALETTAFLDSIGPSLMPRSSLHQGMAMGLGVMVARAAGTAVDTAVRKVAPSSTPLAWRLGVRAALVAGGTALARLPGEGVDEPTARASCRSAGEIVRAAAIGGLLYEASTALRERYPAQSRLRPILTGLGGAGFALWRGGRLLQRRDALITRWTEDDKPASLGASLVVGTFVSNAASLVGLGFRASRQAMGDWFGADPLRRQVGRSANAAMWASGAVGLYRLGVGYIARANERVEPAYAEPPTSDFVSGGPRSISPFAELGLQGRRYVTDVVTPVLIEDTMGEAAIAHPVRAYVGVNSEPLYPSGRSEMAVLEMERLGAFDRSYLLLFCPTGTGWVDHTLISSLELLTRGDVATCCVQYGRSPSFLAVDKVALGRTQFRGLLWGVRNRLADRPPEQRPKILVFGESLGAWASSDVIMHQGIAGFDHYGIDRALWVGLPGLAKWSRTGMREGRTDLVEPGTVGAFDHPAQLDRLSGDERERMRAIVLDHDNDPIAVISARLMVKRPPWLTGSGRGRNVPDSMDWIPMMTFVQVMVDAMNAMRTMPGEFKSFGHDYRGDMARFVQAAYHLPPVSAPQLDAIEETLIRLELDRAQRMATADGSMAELRSGQVQ